MSRSWPLFLGDMLTAARKVQRFAAGRDLNSFRSDDMAFDAIVRNLEVLGEAAKGIPEEVRAGHPEIDWRAIVGLRDVLAHAYFALDDATLWDIVQNKVPALVPRLESIQTQ